MLKFLLTYKNKGDILISMKEMREMILLSLVIFVLGIKIGYDYYKLGE